MSTNRDQLKTGDRRPYRRPTISPIGNLFELTLGGSPGTGDSGNPTLAMPPGGAYPGPPLPPRS